jgi:hypothetical protein
MKPDVILKIAYSVYEKSGIRGSVPCKARYFFSLQNALTGCVADPALYSVGTGG